MVSCLWGTYVLRTFRVPADAFFSVSRKKSLFYFTSVRCGIWQYGGETNTKQNSMNLFLRGYQSFVILFYLYLFIRQGNAPVLSGTPGISKIRYRFSSVFGNKALSPY